MHDSGDLARWAAEIAGLARAGELIDAYVVQSRKRAARLASSGVPAASVTFSTLLRLENTGVSYAVVDGPDSAQADLALAVARQVATTETPVPHLNPAFSGNEWDHYSFNDSTPDSGAARHGRLGELRERLFESLRDQPLGASLKIGDAALIEEHTIHAFDSSDGAASQYSRANLELRVFLDLDTKEGGKRALASAFANRSDAFNISALLLEACQLLHIGASPFSSGPVPSTVLLSPRVTARFAAALIRDVVLNSAGSSFGRLPCMLVDDGRAAGGLCSGLFDQEGTSTGSLPLIDATGSVVALAGRRITRRGPAETSPLLGGFSTRQGYQAAPEPWPRNPRIVADVPVDPHSHSGSIAYGLRGDRVSHMRTARELTFQLDIAKLSEGRPVSRNGTVVLRGTAADFLRSIRRVSPLASYFPGDEFCTGGSWLELDLSIFPPTALEVTDP